MVLVLIFRLFFLQTSFHSLIEDPDVAAEYWGYRGIRIVSSGLYNCTFLITVLTLGFQHLITIKHLYLSSVCVWFNLISRALDCSAVSLSMGDDPPSSAYIFLAVGALL